MRRLRSFFSFKSKPAPADDFFIPELCESEALLGLVLAAELLVLVLVLAEARQPEFDWIRLAFTSLFVQWIMLLSAALFCRLRPWLARLRPAVAGPCCVGLVVLLTVSCTAVADYLELAGPLQRVDEMNLYVRHGLIAAIMSALLLRYFYLQSQWRRQQQAELHARIASLQARIRPHFLFNSLNSIASLIAVSPEKAEQAVLDLSDLFRASLARPDTLVAWRDELALARRYIAIEQYRCGERLRMDWRVADVPADMRIPQLTLQPLLENAVLHGIQPRIEGGTIEVDARVAAGFFELTVSNPYDEVVKTPSPRGTQQGLPNTEARLVALFGSEASLTSERRDGRHVTRLRYPLRD